MKCDKDKSYKCVVCECPSNTLHEIFYNSANRKISIKFNLQVPLCNECHNKAHERKIFWKVTFCTDYLEIDYYKTSQMINNFKENKAYFEGIKDKCLEKIKSWEK